MPATTERKRLEMKILIVDDETPIREWIQFSIERGGTLSLRLRQWLKAE